MNGRQRTVAELAELCGATLEGPGDLAITGPAGLADAGPTEVSFLAQPKYASQLETTRAGAVLVARDQAVERTDLTLLRCDSPEASFTQVILGFAPSIPEQAPGISEFARVDPSAVVAADARLAANVVVGPGATVGAGVVLHAGVVIGAHAKVGAGTVFHPNVVLYPYSEVGERCVVHASAVLGSDGFGFHPVPEGVPADPLWHKTPQAGNVVVEDDCEIGAAVTIDCARFGSTRVSRGCKLDNQVHLGHNVQVGKDTLLLAQVGIAGSSTVGKNVIIAGQAGITGHVHIGDGALILAQAGIIADVAPKAEMIGYPAGPRREKLRSIIGAEKAGKEVRVLKKQVKELQAQIEELRHALMASNEAGDSDSQAGERH